MAEITLKQAQEQVDSWVTELALPLTGSVDGAP